MLARQIGKVVRSPQIYQTLATIGFGFVMGVVPGLIAAKSTVAIAGIGVGAIAFWFISLRLQRPNIDVTIRSPITIRSSQDKQQYARQGFVGFVPAYTPKRESAADKLSAVERLEAIKNLDFDRLGVEESNLQPTIEAICSHQSRLKYCWLLATEGTSTVSSLPYTQFLVEYLQQRRGVDCNFYYGDNYTISMDDDALVLGKTYDLVHRIFQKEVKNKLPAQQMVADISTGVRSMILGMVLACLDEERDIEFVGSKYENDGKIKKDSLCPIIFSFTPDVKVGNR